MIPRFRAWDKEDKRMSYGEVEYYDDSFGVRFDHFCVGADYEVEFMQSTGIKDKNGVEIFEGDIVLEDGMQRIVSFGEQEYEEDFGNLAYYIGFNVYTKCGFAIISPVEYEVIGNVWENPELLEVR